MQRSLAARVTRLEKHMSIVPWVDDIPLAVVVVNSREELRALDEKFPTDLMNVPEELVGKGSLTLEECLMCSPVDESEVA